MSYHTMCMVAPRFIRPMGIVWFSYSGHTKHEFCHSEGPGGHLAHFKENRGTRINATRCETLMTVTANNSKNTYI